MEDFTKPAQLQRIRHFLSHRAGPFAQFVKYAICGGLASAVHIVIFFVASFWIFPCIGEDDLLLRLFGLSPPEIDETRRALFAGLSNALAFVVSNAICYVLNRMFVFRPGRHRVIWEVFLFFAVSGFATIVGTAVMTFLISHWGVQTTLAFVANFVAAVLFNYALRKFFIFKG